MTRLQARSLLVVILLLVSLVLVLLNQAGHLASVKGVLLLPLSTLQRSVTNLTGGTLRSLQGSGDVEALRRQNAELLAQVAQLEKRVVELQENEADLKVLSALLNYARTQPEHTYAAANVIGRDPSSFQSYILIDLGSDAGLRRDMPVVTHQGLVGTVVEVSCCAAKVRLIIDPQSAVNARLQASRDEGNVVGQLGGSLELQYLSQQAEVRPGDVVLTSGLGGTYPEGIVLGRVSAVQRLDYEVLQQAIVTPGVDFSRMEIVLVITNFQPIDLEPFFQSTEAAPAP